MKKVLAVLLAFTLIVLLTACRITDIFSFTEEDVLSGKAYSLYYTPLDELAEISAENYCLIVGFRNSSDCFMENNEDNLMYEGVTIFEARFKGDGSKVKIPEKIKGMKVLGIGSGSFDGCYSISSIEIPDTIELILPTAFDGCNIDLNLIGSVGSAVDSFSKEDCITFNNENRTNSTKSHKIYYVNETEGVRIIGYQNNEHNSVTENTKQKYESQGMKIESIELLGDGHHMIVPKRIHGEEVYAIASGAFIPSNSFYSITIPASVQTVENGAFVETDDVFGYTMIISNSNAVKIYAEDYEFEYWEQHDINDYVVKSE